MAKATESKIDALALAVARGMSVCAASRELHVNISTGRNWSQRPGFWVKVAEIRKQVMSESIGRLTVAAVTASETLADLLTDDHPDPIRLQASKEILSGLIAAVNQAELSDRLTDLAAQIAELRTAGGPPR